MNITEYSEIVRKKIEAVYNETDVDVLNVLEDLLVEIRAQEIAQEEALETEESNRQYYEQEHGNE